MIASAFTDGVRRVVSAPAILLGVYALTVLLALPFALTLRGSIESHLGKSLAATAAAEGVNYDWWQEFTSQASGLATSFTPAIVGFGATLHGISGLADGQPPRGEVAWALAAYLAAWTFVGGGILDRYARRRPIRAHGFFTASGVFFFRFLRLAVVAAVVYWWLFTYVHAWLFDRWYAAATRDVDDERVAFAWRLLMYALFGLSLVAVNVVVDYAKVRAVVEDRRSMFGALAASLRFVRSRAGAVAGLYLLDVAAFLVLVGVWARVAPEVGGSGPGMWVRFAAAQIYLLGRLAIKLQFLSSQTALFQSSLAHAGYVSAPEPAWPPSPAVEAIVESGAGVPGVSERRSGVFEQEGTSAGD